MARCIAILALIASLLLNPWLSQALPDLNSTMAHGRRLAGSTRETVRLLLYDKTKGYLNWFMEWFVTAARDKCSVTCILTEDRAFLDTADMLVFHAPTHTNVPPNPRNIIFTMLSMEQPRYARFLSDAAYLQRHFALLATYSQAAMFPGTSIPNLPLTYFPLNILTPAAVLQPPRPFAEKTGYDSGVSVAVFVSNCQAAGAAARLTYLEELAKLIKIHSYGKCLKNIDEPNMAEDSRWPPIAQRRARKVKVLSQYKFYLAFENLDVDDYVSEKVYEGLFAGTVPVYRGARQIAQFMPSNGSFINANGLNPAALSALLTRLSKDEGAYNKYFAFKTQKLPPEFEQIALRSYTHPNVACRLCEHAAERRRALARSSTR